ncbi:MAG: hypothetical protein QW579_06330 [Desulfurococcaceae archaeon]
MSHDPDPKSKISEVMPLREFKAIQLSKLARLEDELLEKYKDRQDQVRNIIERIRKKTIALRRWNVLDYVATLYELSTMFPELKQLIPPKEAIEKLYGVEYE